MDVELQQRAVEYMSLERKPDLARSNVVAMPPWEKRKSLLLRRMAAREVITSNFPTLTLERVPERSADCCCCAAWLTVRCLLHTPTPTLEKGPWEKRKSLLLRRKAVREVRRRPSSEALSGV